MPIADVEIDQNPIALGSSEPNPNRSWHYVDFKAKTRKALGELLRSMQAGRAVSALWSVESSQCALQVARLIAQAAGCRVLHVRLQQAARPDMRELEAQLDGLFRLMEDQGSILVLDQADALLCSRDSLCRQRFETYLMGRLQEHQGTVIVVMPPHKRVNPRLVRRLHFALALESV